MASNIKKLIASAILTVTILVAVTLFRPPLSPPRTEIHMPTVRTDGNRLLAHPLLPEYVTPTIKDESLSFLVNRQAQFRDRISDDMRSRYPAIKHPQDISAVVNVLLDPKDNDAVRFECGLLLLRSNYSELSGSLDKVLESSKELPRFRSMATELLGKIIVDPNYKAANGDKMSKALSRLHQALDDRDVEVRREALLALIRANDPMGKQAAIQWLNGTGEKLYGVRDIAIRCIYELDLRDQIPNVRKYLNSDNEVIRIAAIAVLSHWGDDDSRRAFKEASESTSIRLQNAGKAALARLMTLSEKLPTGAKAPSPNSPQHN